MMRTKTQFRFLILRFFVKHTACKNIILTPLSANFGTCAFFQVIWQPISTVVRSQFSFKSSLLENDSAIQIKSVCIRKFCGQ